MKKTFILGAVAGASALIAAVPFLAQMSSAAPTVTTSAATSSAAIADPVGGPDVQSTGDTSEPGDKPDVTGTVVTPETSDTPDTPGVADTTGKRVNDQKDAPVTTPAGSITQQAAEAAALASQSGTISASTTLDDQNGTIVYTVQVTSADKKTHDVLVNAKDGTIIKNQEDVNQEGVQGGPDAQDANEQPGTENAGN